MHIYIYLYKFVLSSARPPLVEEAGARYSNSVSTQPIELKFIFILFFLMAMLRMVLAPCEHGRPLNSTSHHEGLDSLLVIALHNLTKCRI